MYFTSLFTVITFVHEDVDLCTEASVVYTWEIMCVICISCFIYLNQY